MFIGSIYNSPIKSSYTRNNDIDPFNKIQEKILTLPQNEFVIIGGDFNARTGKIQDVMEEDDKENQFLNLPDNNHTDSNYRYSDYMLMQVGTN